MMMASDDNCVLNYFTFEIANLANQSTHSLPIYEIIADTQNAHIQIINPNDLIQNSAINTQMSIDNGTNQTDDESDDSTSNNNSDGEKVNLIESLIITNAGGQQDQDYSANECEVQSDNCDDLIEDDENDENNNEDDLEDLTNLNWLTELKNITNLPPATNDLSEKPCDPPSQRFDKFISQVNKMRENYDKRKILYETVSSEKPPFNYAQIIGMALLDEGRMTLKQICDWIEKKFAYYKCHRNWNERNGISIQSLKPILPLLDLHMIPRLDLHTSILEVLRDKLIQQINDLNTKKVGAEERDKKLIELLHQSFELIGLKQLRPVVMAILKNIRQIDKKYLLFLVHDRELYAACDVEVKRQIWEVNQSLFGDEVSPELSQYICEKDTIIFDHLNLNNIFFSLLPKSRRQGQVVQKLAHMIGSSIELYDMVLQFLQTLFLRTRNVHYCTLRTELLMALHDLDVHEIISVDPCHEFIWTLDAYIRDKQFDIKRSRQVQKLLDKIMRGHEQILGDVSMILCDPHAINFLATSAIKILIHLVSIDGLPRSNQILALLLRLLSLGLSAWRMIDTQYFKETKFDIEILTKFLPALTSLMVDDKARCFHSRLTPNERASTSFVIDHEGPVPEILEAYINRSSIASILTMYYALHVAKQKDRIGLLRIMTILPSCKERRAYEDTFLHTLIAHLITMADEFSNEEFCTGLFDRFLFEGLNRYNVSTHIMKLLWHVHGKINRIRLNAFIKAIEPDYTDDLYNALVAKVEFAEPMQIQ